MSRRPTSGPARSGDSRARNADLHCHSTASDGGLEPAALVQRAAEQGVELLALTDHDVLAGVAAARDAATRLGVPFVTGVEISVTYAGRTVHVVGLGFRLDDEDLAKGLESVRGGRLGRARAIADELAAVGIEGAYEGALRHAGNPQLVSRTHFARYLVESGVAPDVPRVFERYLAEGKPGYVPQRWAGLPQAVGWIRAAGGVAVIAHPGRYRGGDTWLWSLCSDFRAAGGIAIEVVSSSHTADDVERFAQVAREFGFEASRGSDFHAPGETHAELGRAAPLPRDLVPVWHRFA